MVLSGSAGKIQFPLWNAFWLAMLNGTVWFLLGLVLVDYVETLTARRREHQELMTLARHELGELFKPQQQLLSRTEQVIEERLTKILEHAAFFTEHNEFRGHVNLLHTTDGKVTWVVAKFISRQLAQSFTELSIDVSGFEYSAFAQDLFGECEQSILLTSPFNIRAWFVQSVGDDSTRAIEQGRGARIRPPRHVLALKSSQATPKRRIVILGDADWADLNCEHDQHSAECELRRRLLEKLLEWDKEAGVETRFVRASRLGQTLAPDAPTAAAEIARDLLRYDYACFDRRLILRWEKPATDKERGPLKLNPTEDRIPLQSIFFDHFDHVGRPGEDVLNACSKAQAEREVSADHATAGGQ